ncbi:hypothetical protein [Xaviernesmea oryzae]|uniref:hypothetical protein n=1 Tax=Xaviernesmea oryzae TaxID=464029 RepID=UPI0008B1AB1C|nr:hypothetical protein [Xaviernesmea oryzae]SEL66481.1 hypothetical protein SAMN04487976_1114 [Xaviernesmea oryzae]
MPARTMMIALLGFVVAAILSILVIQRFDSGGKAKDTQPPTPLTTTPEKAAEETK